MRTLILLWINTDTQGQTLTTFLGSVLNKKYTNPSSDVITVLAGLDQVDQVMTEFVAVLDTTIRSGSNCKHLSLSSTCSGILTPSRNTVDLRLKAIKTAISMTSGAYKTSLITYFTHRDLFPSLMKVRFRSDSLSVRISVLTSCSSYMTQIPISKSSSLSCF